MCCRTRATPKEEEEEKKSHYFPGVGNLKGEQKREEVLHQFQLLLSQCIHSLSEKKGRDDVKHVHTFA